MLILLYIYYVKKECTGNFVYIFSVLKKKYIS